MNKHLTLLTAALLLTSASSAFAASSTDLTVTGTITPAACTPTLSGNGSVDLGKLSAKDLNQDKYTFLPSALLQLSVNCAAATPFALRGIDNRENSSSSIVNYGLGKINGTQNIGNYVLGIPTAMADGVAIAPLESFDDGKTWMTLDGAMWQRQNLAGFGDRSSGAWYPSTIKDLTADLSIHAAIAPARGLDLTDEVVIDGSATIEVNYI